MSAKPPQAPNMDHLRKQAKDVVRLHQSRDSNAAELLRAAHPDFVGLTPEEALQRDIRLSDAQLAVARQHGFPGWSQMKAYIELRPHRADGGIVISETPGLTLEEALNERARRQGMPPIGTKIKNKYGAEWRIADYQFVWVAPALTRTFRDDPSKDPCDFLPVVFPLNPSQRLADFIYEVDRCTSKTPVFVDTMPDTHPLRAGHNIHYVSGGPDTLMWVFHLDIARLRESTLAHELAHIWIACVEGAEDYRCWRDRSDAAKVNQFDCIQSFVLDLWVNDLIEERGFDMTSIAQDEFDGLATTAEAILRGYSPPTKRESAFFALIIAGAILERKRWWKSLSQRLPAILAVFETCLPEAYALASQFIASVERHGYKSREGVRQIVEECARLSFAMTGDDFDLERDLETVTHRECMRDKHPQELAGFPVALKLEIGKARAKNRVSRNAAGHFIASYGRARVEFEEPDGRRIGPFELNFPMSPNALEVLLQLQRRKTAQPPTALPSQHSRHLNPNLPTGAPPPQLPPPAYPHPGQPYAGSPTYQEGHPYAAPNHQQATIASFGFPPPYQPGLPQLIRPDLGGRRRYMAGFGKSLGKARLAERLGINQRQSYRHKSLPICEE